MKRFLLLWAAFTAAVAVATAATSLLVFRHVDLRTETYLATLLAPVFQVAVLMWVREQWRPGRVAVAIGAACRHPLPLGLLVLDGVCLLLGRSPGEGSEPWRAGLVTGWAGAQAVAAGALLLLLASRPDRPGRRTIALGGLVAVALGLAAWAPWPTWLVAHSPARVPTVLAWLVFYGALYIAVTAAALATGAKLETVSNHARTWIEVATAAGFVVALGCLGNFFLHPILMPPWSTVVRVGLTVAATAALSGSAMALLRKG